ncbi:MAG: hypothetical protein AAB728_00800, partial [Patescibacteria group bacterium]
GTLDFATNDKNITVEGNVTLDRGRVDMGDGTWTIGGNFDNADVTTFNRNVSTVMLTGAGKSLLPKSDLYAVTIGTGASITLSAQANNLVTYGTVTVYGTMTADSTFTVYNDGRIKPGGLFTGSSTLRFGDDSRLSEISGTIDVAVLTIDLDHNLASSAIAAGRFDAATVNIYQNTSANRSFVGQAGTYVFTGNVVFGATGAGNYTIDNGTYNSNWTFLGNVSMNEPSTGRVAWTKGTGAITLSGSSLQQVDPGGKSMEDIVVNKTHGIVQLTGTGTLDSMTVSSGTVDFNGKAITTIGDLTIGILGQVNPRGLPGSVLTVGGNLSLTGAAGDLLNLSATGAWTLTVNGASAVATYTTVAYSDASGGTQILATGGTNTDGG